MLLFAVSDEVWQTLINCVQVAVISIVVAWLVERGKLATIRENRLEAERIAEIARQDGKVRAEEVKSALFAVTADQNTKIAGIATGVQAVHSLANSMQDKLVVATEAEALARGAAEEKVRADTEKRGIEKGVEDARVADLKKDIERVPEKTATKVVQKITEPEGWPPIP